MDLFLQFAATDLEESINQLSVTTVLIASVLLILLVGAAMRVVKHKKKFLMLPTFLAIVIVVSGTTLTISGATVYLNIKSATGGPVHWHADFEIWACGNELELRDPVGFLSNKIGTATYHEHNDKRIHLEGVPVSLPHDASLGKFMEVVGGEISKNTMVVPLNEDDLYEDGKNEVDGDGDAALYPEQLEPFLNTQKEGKVASFINGQTCGDETSEVQVFVYNYNAKDKTYTQTKLDDPANYAISAQSEVPAGDCVVFEFGPSKDRTSKLCKQYGIRDKIKCERFGIKPNEHAICENTEMR